MLRPSWSCALYMQQLDERHFYVTIVVMRTHVYQVDAMNVTLDRTQARCTQQSHSGLHAFQTIIELSDLMELDLVHAPVAVSLAALRRRLCWLDAAGYSCTQ